MRKQLGFSGSFMGGVLVAALSITGGLASSADAALVARWELSETSVSDNGNGTWDGVVESVGALPSQIWGPGAAEPLPASLIGNSPGVVAGDRYYAFGAQNVNGDARFGVNTSSPNIVPDTGDFSVFATVRYDSNIGVVTTQEQFFSNNNGQSGRANIGINAGNLFFFANGSINAASNVFIDSNQPTLFDGEWHTVGVNRDSATNDFQLLFDGAVVNTASSTLQLSTNQLWMIGRARAGNSFSTADITDVQVFDDVRTQANAIVPEPTTLLLSALGSMLLIGRRKRS